MALSLLCVYIGGEIHMGNVLRIAICDCNTVHCEEIRRTLQNILFDQCECSISVFTKAHDLNRMILSGAFCFDILFLEVDLDSCTGFEVAAQLRDSGNTAELVFITGNRASVLEGYKYRALDYLLKPVSATMLAEVIQRFFTEHLSAEAVFTFKIGRDVYRLKMKEIVYFMSSGRMITVFSQDAEYTFYGKMDDLVQRLSSRCFIRPHQSFTVNMDYIRCYTKECLTLEGSISIPISRKRMNETLEQLNRFFEHKHVNYF